MGDKILNDDRDDRDDKREGKVDGKEHDIDGRAEVPARFKKFHST